MIHELRRDGFAQAMVFTQYTDTMDFLREELGAWNAAPKELGAWDVASAEANPGAPESRADGSQRPDLGRADRPRPASPENGSQPTDRHRDSARIDGSAPASPENGSQPADRNAGTLRLMCFSGRGGEVRSAGGAWTTIGRDEVKRRFREGEADLLLCTDAAAEGLNFQFCGALINYDMPWNPMRVEQRIGRIDRLGQAHPAIRIVNLHYAGTVETDVYRALRTRIHLFESVVGPLQPILARLPSTIAGAVLAGGARRDQGPGLPAGEPASMSQAGGRGDVVDAIERQVRDAQTGGFDIDATVDTEGRDACAGTVTGGDEGPRPGDLLARSDVARNRGSAPRPPRVWPAVAGNARTPARDHRPRLLRGALGERRALVAGQPALHAAGIHGRSEGRRVSGGDDAERAAGRITHANDMSGGKAKRPHRTQIQQLFCPCALSDEARKRLARMEAAGSAGSAHSGILYCYDFDLRLDAECRAPHESLHLEAVKSNQKPLDRRPVP